MKKLLALLAILATSSLQAQECNGDTHSTHVQDSWLSCSSLVSPNPNRPAGHWILYDLGYVYSLGGSKFWNYNVTGETAKGMKDVTIDYSVDRINWTQAASFQLAQANGTSSYQGVDGPHLGDIQARYVLISSADTWGNTNCAGLSEVKIEVQKTVAIEELAEQDLNLKIYPNPAGTSLNIETEFQATEYIILSLTGHELVRKPYEKTLDISFLADGLYYVKLLNRKQQMVSRKFVKIK